MNEVDILAELQRLAQLSYLEYDLQRKDAAQRLGLRVGTLDDEIAKLMKARPWAEWGRARKPISPPQLARQLTGFGIVPGTIRLSDKVTIKGYHKTAFDDAFSRYAPDPLPKDPPPPNPPDPAPDVRDKAAAEGANNDGVPYPPDPKCHNVTTNGAVGESCNFQNVTDPRCDVSRNGISPYAQKACDGVTDQNGEVGGATHTGDGDDPTVADEEIF